MKELTDSHPIDYWNPYSDYNNQPKFKPLTEAEFFQIKQAIKREDCWDKLDKWLKTDESINKGKTK